MNGRVFDPEKVRKNMEQLSKEHLRGLYLNTHFKLIHDEVISIGTINANIVHPREVFKPAIEYGAAAVIVAHNHPSGVVKPSDADIEVTKQLAAVGSVIGIPLIDHVIIGRGKYASIAVEDV
jgi:DNA repair protein RadC